MLILGIDPGIAIVGWGIIDSENSKILGYGHISTSRLETFQKRLNIIHIELSNIIKTYKPDFLAVEKLFFAKNVKTAIDVGHARGVILLCGEQNQIPVFEYTPLQVKQSVVGYGRAEKLQVQKMVARLLNLKSIPKPDDVADALAIAFCHKQMHKFKKFLITNC